jgi:hypothetical protein
VSSGQDILFGTERVVVCALLDAAKVSRPKAGGQICMTNRPGWMTNRIRHSKAAWKKTSLTFVL